LNEKQVHELIQAAQAGDKASRDALLRFHRPWAESLARRSRWRETPGSEGDAASVALLALNEAIDRYRPGAKSFRAYAYLVIMNRLRDHFRREARQRHLSLDQVRSAAGDENTAEAEHPAVVQQAWAEYRDAEAARERALELAEFRQALAEFGVELAQLPDLAPQHRDARRALVKVARALVADERLREAFLTSKRLPLTRLAGQVDLSRKTLKRWRPFLVAVALILAHPEWERLNEFFADAEYGVVPGPTRSAPEPPEERTSP